MGEGVAARGFGAHLLDLLRGGAGGPSRSEIRSPCACARQRGRRQRAERRPRGPWAGPWKGTQDVCHSASVSSCSIAGSIVKLLQGGGFGGSSLRASLLGVIVSSSSEELVPRKKH